MGSVLCACDHGVCVQGLCCRGLCARALYGGVCDGVCARAVRGACNESIVRVHAGVSGCAMGGELGMCGKGAL